MKPILCLIGGCNGAGKTTLAREILPLMGIRRFLNADEISKGLSPLDPSLSAFRAGRLIIEEAHSLIRSKCSFALESTLSGRAQIALLQQAKEQNFRLILHYVLLASDSQAVERVALRVVHGGHDVPEADVRRRFYRSRQHLLDDYLPLADEWTLWDNSVPPVIRVAHSSSHTLDEIHVMLDSPKFQESADEEMPEMVRIGLEASRRATAKMLDFYRRMDIEVTPQMTLTPAAKARFLAERQKSANQPA